MGIFLLSVAFRNYLFVALSEYYESEIDKSQQKRI